MTVLEEIATLKRALALRRAGRLGVLYAEDGRLYVCGHPFDPLGYIAPLRNAYPYSYPELSALVAELEADRGLSWLHAPHGPYPRKAPAPIHSARLEMFPELTAIGGTAQ